MILREEIFEQTEGLGVLELRGGELELALFLNGEPLVYDAADCAGSVGRFTVLLPSSQNLLAQVQIGQAAEQGFQSDALLSEQIAPLLQLLHFGTHRLTLEELSTQNVLDWEGRDNKISAPAMGYYPYGQTYQQIETLITTQPDAILSDDRINFYIAQIEGGTRPALIVLGAKGHDTAFIIDGHHKLFAYYCCGAKPRFLRIELGWQRMISNFVAHQALEGVEWPDIPRYLWRKRAKSV